MTQADILPENSRLPIDTPTFLFSARLAGVIEVLHFPG